MKDQPILEALSEWHAWATRETREHAHAFITAVQAHDFAKADKILMKSTGGITGQFREALDGLVAGQGVQEDGSYDSYAAREAEVLLESLDVEG